MKDNRVGMTLLEQQYMINRNQILDKKTVKTSYEKPKQSREYKDGTEILRLNNAQQTRKTLQNYGMKFMNDYAKKLAIVVFAGGLGQRSGSDLKQFKEVSYMHENMIVTTKLFNQAMLSIQKCYEMSCKVFVYIICNKINSKNVIEYVQQKFKTKHPQIPIYICQQHESPLLTHNGVQNIYKKQTNQKLTYPSGIGSFRKATIQYGHKQSYTLQDHLLNLVEPDLVYCIGCTDFDQRGVNMEMIGLIDLNDLDCVFACAEYQGVNKKQMPVVCITTKANNDPAWLVMEDQSLKEITQKNIENFPVWKDNFVFSPRILQSGNKPSKNYSQVHHQFIYKNLANKKNNNPQQKLKCIVCEETISFSILRNKKKCVGYMYDIGSIYKTQEDLNRLMKQKNGGLSSPISKAKRGISAKKN